MPGSYYIHNVYSGSVTAAFGDEKIKQQLAYQQSQLQSLNKSIAAQYKKTVGSTKEFTQKMNLLEGKLPEIMQRLVSNLPTINWNFIRQALVTHDVEQLQSAISKIKSDIQQYTLMYNQIAELGAQDLATRPTWLTDKALARLTTQHNRMLEVAKQLDRLLTEPENQWRISAYLSRTLGTAAGYMAEYATTNILEQTLGPLGIHFRQAGTGNVRGSYKTRTEDISIVIEDKNGTVLFSLPGISLKRTSTGTAKNPNINIHLKSTSVGNLITFGKMVDGGFDLNTFYNAYANNNRITRDLKTGKTITNKVTGLRQMYKAFYFAALNTALTGSMVSGDYGYYLIINERVFTALDVIQSVLSGNSAIVGGQGMSLKGINTLDQLLDQGQSQTTLQAAQPLIAKYHQEIFFNKYLNAEIDDQNEADARSAEMVAKIDALTVTLNLKMNLSQLI